MFGWRLHWKNLSEHSSNRKFEVNGWCFCFSVLFSSSFTSNCVYSSQQSHIQYLYIWWLRMVPATLAFVSFFFIQTIPSSNEWSWAERREIYSSSSNNNRKLATTNDSHTESIEELMQTTRAESRGLIRGSVNYNYSGSQYGTTISWELTQYTPEKC